MTKEFLSPPPTTVQWNNFSKADIVLAKLPIHDPVFPVQCQVLPEGKGPNNPYKTHHTLNSF